MSQRLGQRWILASCVLVLIILVAMVDLWAVGGKIVDQNGAPIKGVKVLVTLHAEGLRAPIPHAWNANSSCLASTVTETDSDGRFAVFRITQGAGLAEKSVTARTFIPGWHQSSYTQRFNSLLLSGNSDLQLTLQPDRGERWSFMRGRGKTTPLTLDASSPLYESTMSRALTGAADLGSSLSGCGGTGESLVEEALTYAIRNASTKDELRYIRNRCIDAGNRKRSMDTASRSNYFDAADEWPNVCRRLF